MSRWVLNLKLLWFSDSPVTLLLILPEMISFWLFSLVTAVTLIFLQVSPPSFILKCISKTRKRFQDRSCGFPFHIPQNSFFAQRGHQGLKDPSRNVM
ncbi:MAG: hypothetical protein [Circular genetic element sp.]|nr:MAG: hypothetical protein [Circular genetic element sp.]